MYLALPAIALYPPAEAFIERLLRAVFFISLIWFSSRSVDVGAARVLELPTAQHNPAARSLVPLGSKIVKVTLTIIAGIVLAVLALVPIVLVRRVRLSADASGVTVVNLLRTHRIPWSEVSVFRLGRVARLTCVDVCKWDGSRVHSWVATSSSNTVYQRYVIAGIVADLRERLAYANGEPV